jgi:uncharacterized protein (DUF433 family)
VYPRPAHPVATVVGMVAGGMSTSEILAACPDLEREDVKEAVRFAADAGRRWRLTEILIR